MLKVQLEAQGRVFLARVTGFAGEPCMGADGETVSRRGNVAGFSRKSRKRLLDKVNRLDGGTLPVFVTLTTLAVLDARQAKVFLAAWLKRLRRAYPASSAVWRLEYQKRGAAHFHLLVYGVPFLPKEWVQASWGAVVGQDRPFTRVEGLRSIRGVAGYVSKYLAKVDPGLDTMPYLTATPGRFWGVFGADRLPWAELLTVAYHFGTGAWYYALRRCARHAWRGVSKRAGRGFSLYRDSAPKWLAVGAWYYSQ